MFAANLLFWVSIGTVSQPFPYYDQICSVKILKNSVEAKDQIVSTRARVQPIACLLGKSLGAFDVLWPGGFVEGNKKYEPMRYRSTKVADFEPPKIGDRVLFFLRQRKDKVSYVPSSLKFGIIPLRFDSKKKKYYLPSAWAKEKLNQNEAEVKDLFAYLKKTQKSSSP